MTNRPGGTALWLRKLHRLGPQLMELARPRDPEASLRETLTLADLGWRQLLGRLRQERPDASEDEIQRTAYQLLCEFQRVRNHMRYRSS